MGLPVPLWLITVVLGCFSRREFSLYDLSYVGFTQVAHLSHGHLDPWATQSG